jgi:hypothetical protein
VYYHLYSRVGEDTSKVAFNPNKPALSRIEKIHISPPHEPGSIVRCIARAERKPIYAYAELYQDISDFCRLPKSRMAIALISFAILGLGPQKTHPWSLASQSAVKVRPIIVISQAIVHGSDFFLITIESKMIF